MSKIIEIPFGAQDSKNKGWEYTIPEGMEAVIEDGKVIVREKESEDENLKNKSGYYKAGKFWKASTLWNATKDKIPQRVPNRYILQECVWNIGTLQQFADEIKNVQEVSLDYPIILDMNRNILDGAHRVVKAYLEGKDIDIVYLGDDEWPEPDYDEEKAVKDSEDERIRKFLKDYAIEMIAGLESDISISVYDGVKGHDPDAEEKLEKWRGARAWLEKQKEQKPAVEQLDGTFNSYDMAKTFVEGQNYVITHPDKFGLCKPAEWSEEDEKMLQALIHDLGVIYEKIYQDNVNLEKELNWLKSLRPSWKPSEEQMEALKAAMDRNDNIGYNLGQLYKQLKQL